MPALARKIMKLFGSSAGGSEIGVFGSLAAAAPAYSSDPDEIQSLSNWLAGWYAAVVGNNSPAIQDWNAVFYVMSYQLCYYFERGIAEWSATTTYYIGSQASDSNGDLFASIADDNLDNPLTDGTKWRKLTLAAGSQTFHADGTWEAPFGVTKVTVEVENYLPSQIGGGGSCTTAVRADGIPMGFGYGELGALALAPYLVSVSSPVLWGGLGWGVRQVVSGVTGLESWTHILTYQGSLYSAGSNADGRLGDNSVTDRSAPVLVSGSRNYKYVNAAHSSNGYAITIDGNAYAWGANLLGQLGDGTLTRRSSPVLVSGGHKFVKVSGGNAFAVGLLGDGSLVAWGDNNYGQLGDGNNTIIESTPVVVLGGRRYLDIACMETSTVALGEDGNLYAWGANDYGELGDGTTNYSSSPVLVLGGGRRYVQVGAGGASGYAISEAGDMYAWGLNGNGQLGLNDRIPRSSPVLVLGGLKFIDVAGMSAGAAGITPDGSLYCWGANSEGQLGDNSRTPRSSPVLVFGGYTWGTGVRQATVASRDITVVPGQTYDVTVNGTYVRFNNQLIWKNGSTRSSVTIRYAG